MLRKLLASLALPLAMSSACNKAEPQLPVPLVLMETPPPPARLFIPVELPEPAPPPPEAPEPPAPVALPPRPNPVTPTRTVERPASATPPEVTPPPVLRTNTDTAAAERRIAQLIDAAEQNLNKVNYRDLNAGARTQYDFARNFLRIAANAVKVKNYTYAESVATRAASLAGLLIKG